jgi:hypothetical protein
MTKLFNLEPTESEWACVGRYLAGRMLARKVNSDGTFSYGFSDIGRHTLRGTSVVSAVMQAIVAEAALAEAAERAAEQLTQQRAEYQRLHDQYLEQHPEEADQ